MTHADTNADYQLLLDQLAAAEPRDGYHSIVQLRLLTPAELAAVLRNEPDGISDVLAPATDYIQTSVLRALAATDINDTYDILGRVLFACLQVEAKRLLLVDVQDECSRREREQRELAVEARRGDVGAALAAEGAL